MDLKIERPCFKKLLEGIALSQQVALLEDWFKQYVEPINKLLALGVQVHGATFEGLNEWTKTKLSNDDHKALLINIQPIKKETAEDVLRDLHERCLVEHEGITSDLARRIKVVLGEEL